MEGLDRSIWEVRGRPTVSTSRHAAAGRTADGRVPAGSRLHEDAPSCAQERNRTRGSIGRALPEKDTASFGENRRIGMPPQRSDPADRTSCRGPTAGACRPRLRRGDNGFRRHRRGEVRHRAAAVQVPWSYTRGSCGSGENGRAKESGQPLPSPDFRPEIHREFYERNDPPRATVRGIGAGESVSPQHGGKIDDQTYRKPPDQGRLPEHDPDKRDESYRPRATQEERSE